MHVTRSRNDPVRLTRMLYMRKVLASRSRTGTRRYEKVKRVTGEREEARARRYMWIDERGMRVEAATRNSTEQIEALNVETQPAQVPVGGIERHE
ncbi:MAG TPA: hypothetical protein VF952_10300 [Chloroflexia bacterium]|jgi:hypothetical protein